MFGDSQTQSGGTSSTTTSQDQSDPASSASDGDQTPVSPPDTSATENAMGTGGQAGAEGAEIPQASGGMGGALENDDSDQSPPDAGIVATGSGGAGGEPGSDPVMDSPDAGSSPMTDTDPAETEGPAVDRSNPQLFTFQFTARDADPAASEALGRQYAYLDTRVEPKNQLVVYLHGAGEFGDCGNGDLGTLVASFGYHWFGPCFLSNYGVDNCGDDIGGCRLEALEGEDHHPFVDISRPNSIEERIVRGLSHLDTINPEGDWTYFLDGELPRWDQIVITGHSHGASTSGIIGMTRTVARVVMLAGPYDVGQAWLSGTPATPPERFFGFTHTGDGQHQGHLAALEALGLPGIPTSVDGAAPPYGGSHRLTSSANVGDAHGSVTSGNIAGFIDAWTYLYTSEP
jgi:hypothetical protein